MLSVQAQCYKTKAGTCGTQQSIWYSLSKAHSSVGTHIAEKCPVCKVEKRRNHIIVTKYVLNMCYSSNFNHSHCSKISPFHAIAL
jgi:hypothetical protein